MTDTYDYRITVDRLTDYAWPYVAKLEARIIRAEWQEIDAWGGDTAAEAIATLRDENRTARAISPRAVAASTGVTI